MQSSKGLGPELADSILAVIRHRYNLRMSKIFDGFILTGHYDHDKLYALQSITKELFGTPILENRFPLLDERKVSHVSLQLGVAPILVDSNKKQLFNYTELPTIFDKSKKPYPSTNLLYVMKQQQCWTPYLPFKTVEEKLLFKLVAPQFVDKYSGKIMVNYLCDKWNGGLLEMPPVVSQNPVKYETLRKYWRGERSGTHKSLIASVGYTSFDFHIHFYTLRRSLFLL